ncbi:hypothetical protein EXIGLDRAFT_726547, partial [Exidia glandulosa HHB12029]
MYLIEHLMNRSITPERLQVLEREGVPEDVRRRAGGGGSALSVAPTLPARPLSTSPSTPSFMSSSVHGHTPIHSSEAARAFARLDTQGTGRVEGGVLLPYFIKSGLDVDTLAEIWDQADVNKDGWLETREFEQAFELVRARVPDFDSARSIAEDLASLSFGPGASASSFPNLPLSPVNPSQSTSPLNRSSTISLDHTPSPRFDAPLPQPPAPPPLPNRNSTLPPLPADNSDEPIAGPVLVHDTGATLTAEPPPAYTLEVGEGERAVEQEAGDAPAVVRR